MRSVCFSLLLLSCAVMARGQVNPHTQIRWPSPSCSTAGQVYDFSSNTCIPLSSMSGQVAPSTQINWPGSCTTAGTVYSLQSNSCVPMLNWRGAWSAGTYATNDVVSYLGSSYISTAAGNTATPPNSPWSVLAQAGAIGPPGGSLSYPGVTTNGANGLTVTGAVGAGTSTPTTIGSTGVTFPDGTVQSSTATLPASAVQVGTDGSGKGKAISAWQRQGIAIAPVPSDPSQQVQEASAILDSSPEILSGSTYSQVVKHTFTCGWWPGSLGGAGMNICFAESADGLTNMSRYSANPIITNHARSYLMSSKVSGNYVLFATDMVASPPHVDMYTGSTIHGLTLAHANILRCGSNGAETTQSIGMGGVFVVSGNHWRGFYDCQLADGQYVTYLADSTDAGVTWTKTSTTPVVGESSAITCGGLCYNGGGMDAHYIGGTLHIWGHWGPNSGVPGVPTPYIWHFSDSSGDPGKHLVADALPAMQSQTTAEGVNTKAGQFADPYLLDMGALNKTILYATTYTNGCSALAICSVPAYITASTIDQPLTNVVAGIQQDNSQSLGPVFVAVNGTPLSRRDVMNITGTGITDAGNGAISFPASSYTTAPFGPLSPGSAGQFAAASGFFYVYDSALGKWLQITGSSSWTPTYQTSDSFTGTVGTLLTAHTDGGGHSWAVYTAEGLAGTTSSMLDGSGNAYLTSGTSTTAYGDMLNSLTPSSANYTVSITCSPVSSTGGTALFLRANNAAATYYVASINAGAAATVALYKGVSGTVTNIGTNYGGGALRPWNTGTAHTFIFQVSGTTLTAKVDSTTAVTVTDSAIAAAGQSGFRVTGGSSITCTNFNVQ
jgi:hypothetical protein